MKLTKAQAKAHEQACELLNKERLDDDERWFVLEHWRAGARHINTLGGAHFTPRGLARDFAIEVSSGSVIDLCAGIGMLAFCVSHRADLQERIVCVEINPDYVEVGRKILPQATWICGDVFQLPVLGHFQFAIANPPFGTTHRSGQSPRYTGARFEYHVIDIASDLANNGVFLIPQQSAPFCFSGRQSFSSVPLEQIPHYSDFVDRTGIELTANCGIDTSAYRDDWHDVRPVTEIVTADFADARDRRSQGSTADLYAVRSEGSAA